MKIATIADIHFGYNNNSLKLYEELTFFVETCKKENVDLIVILGDLFDKKLSLNTDANIYCNMFIRDLDNLNKCIFLIHGTLSHDNNQIDSYSCYLSDRFFIFKTKQEFIFKGNKFLILPEEYVNDNTYYDDIKEKSYDYVFGHGMFKHASFGDNNNKNYYSNYIFEAKDFDNVKNFVVFGHIHTPSIHRKVVYNGSFTRMNFGEMEAKGFNIFEKNKYKFYENLNAPNFISIEDNTLPDNIDILLKKLNGLMTFNDNMRIILTEENKEKNDIIKTFIKNNSKNLNKSFVLLDKRILINNIIKNEEDDKKESREIIEKYKNKSFEEIILDIFKNKYPETNITLEKLNDILN